MIGVGHSYLWNRYWTFRATGSHVNQGAKFLLVNLVALAVTKALMRLFVEGLHVSAVVAPFLVLVITTAISYFSYKHWSFRA